VVHATTVVSLAIVAGACFAGDVPVAPRPSELVVHAVLDMGSRDQQVVLERTRTGEPQRRTSPYLGSGDPVVDAHITLTTPSGTVLTAIPDTATPTKGEQQGLYHIPLDVYGISLVPGGTYTLRIQLPSGEEASGSTTMPQALAVAPGDTETFDARHDSLRLAWAPVHGAAAHEVRIRSRFGADACCFDVDYSAFADSTFVMSGHATTLADDPIFLTRSVVTATVAAVDGNYYEYFRVLSDPFVGAPPSRLRGAVGVFGSLVVVRRRTLKVQ